ncbi:T6SS effector phospholipase Tle3 domain-containing protein [Franconibacter daqui]|uniref:DUF3274 domain-containing protein n=1 Tax=Franconibacter daqui TaxID=2047724 RepID=A0ABV1PQ61_9ENTR
MENSTKPYRKRVVIENDPAVHADLGLTAQTCNIGVPRPMPCIVILVHGVNDVGEAYENQERGIVAGLGRRLSRSDFYPHEWREFLPVHNGQAQKKICAPGRSPVIPFYWGYKPVTREEWAADQRRYRDEVSKLNSETRLPYDAYQENDREKKRGYGNDEQGSLKFENDCYGNTLDTNFAKNGGTFANATTSIPDMLGPGAGGAALAAAGFISLYMNGGDYTHPIYRNPHRIYQFFAAQRLAELILRIRREPRTEKDVINIVAHSQGTLITMLANMLVKQAGFDPANCCILNHSPYALEDTLMENIQDGHHQTRRARQETFSNFCRLMATQYSGGEHTAEEMARMEARGTLPRPVNAKWHSDPRYRRNNNGKVYNYFCPNDGTVSLKNVQGIGWRGIPASLAETLPNLRQRVFCQGAEVGQPPDGVPFRKPKPRKGDFSYSGITNAEWDFRDVIVSGEALPEPFVFELMGEHNHPDADPATCDEKYKGQVSGPDREISYSARAVALKRTEQVIYTLPNYRANTWPVGYELNEKDLAMMSGFYNQKFIRGIVRGSSMDFRSVEYTRLKSDEQLHQEWEKADPVSYSQHSSIVMSDKAPSHAMAFDLAIGQCEAFDYREGKFWEMLLHTADWRDRLGEYAPAKEYYRTGELSFPDTKRYMNRPDEILPKGEFGVVNEYAGQATTQLNGYYTLEGATTVYEDQWKMPAPLSEQVLMEGIKK